MVLRWEGPFTWAMPDMVLTIAVVRIVVDVQLTTKTVMISSSCGLRVIHIHVSV